MHDDPVAPLAGFEEGDHWPQHPSRAERRSAGKAVRARLPLARLAETGVASGSRDVVALVGAGDAGRLPELVPIRYGRMLRDAFTFFRGTAGLMARDLAAEGSSGLTVQLCGDAHLLNFGLYGSPERALVFDLNDFDETLPGPFEWDVKRLVASMVLAARSRGCKPKQQRAIARAAAWRYRDAMRGFSKEPALTTWYAQQEVEQLLAGLADSEHLAYATKVVDRARGKDASHATRRLTELVDGVRRIKLDPPLIESLSTYAQREVGMDAEGLVRSVFLRYRESVADDVRILLDRYTYVDSALKVVGVGSVGTRCAIVVLQGGGGPDDLLFLQVKEAGSSVLAPHLGASRYTHGGQRVVAGQRLMQSASDAFLGWATGPKGVQYYWRQLRDWKGSVDVGEMSVDTLLMYGRLCAWTLAKAHARSGDPAAISGYLGSSERFEEALVAYGQAYADQTERDYAELAAAARDGRITADQAAMRG